MPFCAGHVHSECQNLGGILHMLRSGLRRLSGQVFRLRGMRLQLVVQVGIWLLPPVSNW